MQVSKHAAIRARQRGIPYDCIDLIMQFGTVKTRPGKTSEYQMTRRDIQEALNHLKYLIQLLDKAAHKAVLVGGDIDQIITVYNRAS